MPEIKSLDTAIKEALNKPTEKERIISLLSCIKPYRNEFNLITHKKEHEGYEKCSDGIKRHISKIINKVENRLKN